MADASGFVELPAAPSPPSYDGSLVWSPDSARLAFTRYTATGGELAVMDADDSNAAVIASLGTATAITPGAWTGITYSADASVTGNLEVVKDSSGVRQVHGFGTYTGAGASTASVALAVNRFWILPIHVGSVRVVDPGASLSLNHLVFFSNVAAAATGSTSTQSWFDLSRWPWRSYSMTWQVDDIT